jgi:hypothetical protein
VPITEKVHDDKRPDKHNVTVDTHDEYIVGEVVVGNVVVHSETGRELADAVQDLRNRAAIGGVRDFVILKVIRLNDDNEDC